MHPGNEFMVFNKDADPFEKEGGGAATALDVTLPCIAAAANNSKVIVRAA